MDHKIAELEEKIARLEQDLASIAKTTAELTLVVMERLETNQDPRPPAASFRRIESWLD